MRWTTVLAFSAGLLMACGHGGGGEDRASEGARAPGGTEARAGGSSQAPAAEAVPFGPRSEERRRQDSVIRSGSSRRRERVPSDTT